MKKIISLALVFILVVSMGSFTFAKPSPGWDRWSDDAFDEYEGFIPPGLRGKGLPPGLAKQNKIPNGWNKGDKPQFEERHQWREQNREIQDLEQLVTRVENYLEDLEANHGDFYNQYDDKDEIIYELNDLLDKIDEYLETIDDVDNPSEGEMDQLNEYYNALEDKLEELKDLVKEELGENKAKLENLKEVLNYILDEEVLSNTQETAIGTIIEDIDDLLEGFVTTDEYNDILDDVDAIDNFDDLLEAYIVTVKEDIEEYMYNYDSDELDAVEDKIDEFYDTDDDFDVDEEDADEAYIALYWLVKDMEEDYDQFMAYKDELEMIFEELDEVDYDDLSSSEEIRLEAIMDDIKDVSEATGLVYETRVTETEFLNLLEDALEFIDYDYSVVVDIEALIEDIEDFIADENHDFVEDPDAANEFDIEIKEALEAKIDLIEDIIVLEENEDLSDEYKVLDTELEELQELYTDLLNSEG